MKLSFQKILGFSIFLLIGILAVSSCTKDDEPDPVVVGNPEISYFRSTDPALSDSLMTGAFMGSLIAIIGNDLESTVEIWFNDQRAALSPTYVTPTSILVNVPSTVPGEVNNMIRLVFADSSELEQQFFVNVPAPTLNRIKSEYVETGDLAILTGDFYFEPMTVTFTGGKEADIAFIEKTRLEVVVPEGAEVGPITITTNFGTVVSDFIFRDNQNLVANGDNLLHRSWNAPIADPSSGEGRVPSCSGRYIELLAPTEVGAWTWVNELNLMYIAEDAETGRGNFPIFPGEANVNEWGVRFELNVQFEWREIPLEIFFAPFGGDHGRDNGAAIAQWSPWEATGLYEEEGWTTVTVPLTDFNQDSQGVPNELGDLGQYTNLTLMLFGAAENKHDPYIAIDNVRIVRL